MRREQQIARAHDALAERPFRSDETLKLLREFDIARDFQPAHTPQEMTSEGIPVCAEQARSVAFSPVSKKETPSTVASVVPFAIAL